jgi:hypothetical protein
MTHEVSTFRLYLLRATYLLMAVGLTLTIGPGLVSPPENLSHMASVVRAVLGAVALLSYLGLRYPIKMLPLLFFEFLWKVLWVGLFGIPLWLNGRLDEGTSETLFNCLLGVVLVPLAVPWPYVWRHYVKAAGDRWKG